MHHRLESFRIVLVQHGTNMPEPIWRRNGFVGAHLEWNNERVLDIDFIDETRRGQYKLTLAGTDCGTHAMQKKEPDRGLLTLM